MKENENEDSIKMATPIVISNTPKEIEYNDIDIKQGECFLNSYRVANKYPDVEIVEGLIIMVDDENGATAMPHVWNKIGDTHFDVTSDRIWTGRKEREETKEINYFFVKTHNATDFKNGSVFEFCFDTNENVAAIKETIKKNNSGND